MGPAISTDGRPLGRGGWVATAALLGVLLLGAAPARAGGDFGDGFEDELGRIAAREVIRFGKFVLSGGHGPFYYAQWAAAYPAPGYEAYGVYPRPVYRRPVRHRHPVWQPVHPAAAHPAPAYPPPPPYAEPCDHEAAPYDERIVYERYERVINRSPYRDDQRRHAHY